MLLNLFFLPVSAAVTVAILMATEISYWWGIPLFFGAYVGTVIVYFIGLFVASLLMPKKNPKHSSAVCRGFATHTMHWLMPIMGIFIRLTGEEKLPDCPCVFVSNHRSDFDPMTMLAVLRKRKLAYISKEENFRIPIVGPFIRNAGFVGIDRGNGLRAVKTLQRAAEYMKTDGLDFGIYPEGTRSRTGKLLRFKPGACYLAQLAEAPIVILTTQGTEKISKRFLFSPIRVHLNIVEVIPRETVMSTDQNELIAYIRTVVENNLPPEVSEKED